MEYITELKFMMVALRSRGVRAAIATDYRGAVTHNYGFTDYTALAKPRRVVPVTGKTRSLTVRLAEAADRLADRLQVMGEIAESAIVKNSDPEFERWMIIHPSIEGGWRLTTFARDGFYGHMGFVDKASAMKEAAQCGYFHRDDGALDRLQDAPEFQRGGYVQELLDQMNAGDLTAFDAAFMLNKYDELKVAA